MHLSSLVLIGALIITGLAGCHTGLAHLNRAPYHRVSRYDYKQFRELRRQLVASRSYRGYQRSQLRFEAVEIKGGYGLYNAIMPGKSTVFNIVIPCLIGRKGSLLNSCYFHGKPDGDTTRLIAALDSTLTGINPGFSLTGNYFTAAEQDSIRKYFLNGGYIVNKPGHNTHWR